jgi:UDPglucose 6-dehydrogenase
MKSNEIGVIGFGYVGEAVVQSIDPPFLSVIMDPERGWYATYDEIKKCEAIFICVPSPTIDGVCDTSILSKVLDNLKGYKGVIISKVTAPPKFYEEKAIEFPNLVHVPEFLTAEQNVMDYVNATWTIIGGEISAYQREAAHILKYTQHNLKNVEFCRIGEAAMLKYIINSFLATKVTFMNEMEQLAQKHNYEWQRIEHFLKMDNRMGHSHMKVPGPDGFYGFGGGCFPKDTEAFINYAKSYDVSLNVLDAAVKKNTLLRLTKPK